MQLKLESRVSLALKTIVFGIQIIFPSIALAALDSLTIEKMTAAFNAEQAHIDKNFEDPAACDPGFSMTFNEDSKVITLTRHLGTILAEVISDNGEAWTVSLDDTIQPDSMISAFEERTSALELEAASISTSRPVDDYSEARQFRSRISGEPEVIDNTLNHNQTAEIYLQSNEIFNLEQAPNTCDSDTLFRDKYRTFAYLFFDKRDLIESSAQFVPEVDAIDSQALPESKQVKLLVSGGTGQDYSNLVAKNQAAFAKARKIPYQFVSYSESEDDPDSNAVHTWLTSEKIQPYWGKVFLIKRLLEYKLADGEWLVWMDDDIVVNDFSNNAPTLDTIISSVVQDTCIITTKDIRGHNNKHSSYPNTGIIMAKKTPWCLKVLEHWLEGAADGRMGKSAQDKTLHEQEYLADVFHGNAELEFEDTKRKLSSSIVFINPRTEQWNINTFKRFDHKTTQGHRHYKSDLNHSLNIAALPADAYVHHTGMASLYRQALIVHTLWLIRKNYPLIQ